MPEGVVTALIASLSALGGAAIAHWGAARIQTQQDLRAAARERQALLRQQRAECLGWVLEARTRIEALMPRLSGHTVPPVAADRTAGAAARQAYAAALLYLADARPLAMAFYRSTVQLQLALERPSEEVLAGQDDLVGSWQADYEALECCLADMIDFS